MVRSEPYLGLLTEKLFREKPERTNKVAHSNALVHNKHFYLMESRRMRSIKRIRPVYLTRAYDLKRRLLLLHNTDLHAGSLSSQKNLVIKVKSILCISGRMSLRYSEKLEVILVKLDFRTFGY